MSRSTQLAASCGHRRADGDKFPGVVLILWWLKARVLLDLGLAGGDDVERARALRGAEGGLEAKRRVDRARSEGAHNVRGHVDRTSEVEDVELLAVAQARDDRVRDG